MKINWVFHMTLKKQLSTYEMAMFAKTQTKMMLNWPFHMTAKNKITTYERNTEKNRVGSKKAASHKGGNANLKFYC